MFHERAHLCLRGHAHETSERCTGTWAHMLWFQCTSVTRSVAHEAMIDDLGLMIKYPNMLALVLCTSERCTQSGHICCGCSAHQSQGLSASSDEAVTDELG